MTKEEILAKIEYYQQEICKTNCKINKKILRKMISELRKKLK